MRCVIAGKNDGTRRGCFHWAPGRTGDMGTTLSRWGFYLEQIVRVRLRPGECGLPRGASWRARPDEMARSSAAGLEEGSANRSTSIVSFAATSYSWMRSGRIDANVRSLSRKESRCVKYGNGQFEMEEDNTIRCELSEFNRSASIFGD